MLFRSVIDGIAVLVLVDGSGLAVDAFMFGFASDRVHGDDPPHGGAFAFAVHIHRRLDEGVQQAVVAVVGQGFKAKAAVALEVDLGEGFLGGCYEMSVMDGCERRAA